MSMMVFQLTGEQLCALIQFAIGLGEPDTNPGQKGRTLVSGVQALADGLGCSPSTIYGLMRTAREEDGSAADGGILRDAIVSRIGRRIVFDTEIARARANEYQKNKKED